MVSFKELGSKIGSKLDEWFVETDEERVARECKEKGDDFEAYILNLIVSNNKEDKKYFEVVDWTRDIDKNKIGIEVTSNKNPDLLIKYLPTNEKFAVECKFRSDYVVSERFKCKAINWSYPDQIKRYQEFEKEHNCPVFIVIGIGGDTSNPNTLYCIPLSEAKFPELLPTLFEKYERSPTKKLFWNYKEKKLL